MGRHVIVGFALLFLLSIIAQLGFCGRCIESEKQALLKFKASIHHYPFKNLSSWNPKTNCCQWDGIACHNVTGHILKLNLYYYGLEAIGVDPSLLELQHLIYLDLSWNNFHAISIPAFFSYMEKLRYLSISRANFTGKISNNLGGNLTDLQFLDLSHNHLHINDMSWVSKLQSLQHLNLSGVYLGEAHNLFQVLHMLPSLLQLQLEGCGLVNLTTPLPPINFTNNVRVQLLNLASNEIDDQILNAFQNWTSVEFLNLNYNNLSSAPLWFGEFKNLVSLDLSSNILCGPIPIALRNLTSLEDLYLSSNNFSSVPLRFGEFKNLVSLDLSSNILCGPIPIALRNLTSLEDLNLSSNNFSSVPSWFGEFKNLVSLHLSSNILCGPIPIALRNLTSLEDLNLSSNNFSSVPSWFGEFKNLVSLDLSSNILCGPIPIALRNLTTLEDLELSSNNFSLIPSWLGELWNLRYLDISDNQIIATMKISVPQILKNMCHLQVLDIRYSNLQAEAFSDSDSYGCIKYEIEELHLSNNKFNGHLPTWIKHLENLQYLDLSNNYFSGNIPQSLGQLANLQSLDLSSNSFSSNVPQSLAQLVSLIDLDLSNNSFSGNIPQRLCHLVNLQRLDLSHNNFSSEIPNCWRENHPFGLMEINFSFNKLSSRFPISIGKLSFLLWLHLNNNYLEGKLPLTLKNLKQLRILDLGENNFFGSIPPWTGNTFPTLQILKLRDNMLDGNIPIHLCQLQSLQILDLANNSLSGPIPHCIGNLTGMTKDSTAVWESTEQKIDITNGMYIFLSEWRHQDVIQVMKGIEFDIIGILQLEVNLDLSCNNLTGLIPLELFSLIGLIGFNLSHNHLKGEIPDIIENMKSLESFDISCNQISGTIPKTMSKLTTLSHLNMSYNNISGPIPTENQFLTLNDPSIYAGNPYLCGIPLQIKCQGDDTHQVLETKEFEDENDSEKVWFYFVIAIGFIVGFWGVIGTLVLKKSWRYACFRRVEDVADEIYVYTSIKMAKLKRLLTNHVHV